MANPELEHALTQIRGQCTTVFAVWVGQSPVQKMHPDKPIIGIWSDQYGCYEFTFELEPYHPIPPAPTKTVHLELDDVGHTRFVKETN